jgi:hypothetical protein
MNASDNSVSTRTLRSIMCNCSSRSRVLASPTSPNPALLTTNCGSAPCAANNSRMRSATPGLRRSAAITTGRRAPVEAISSASAFNLSSLRATNANSWPWRAKTRASARPIPADAPVMTVTGRSSLIGAADPHAIGRHLRRPILLFRVRRSHELGIESFERTFRRLHAPKDIISVGNSFGATTG